jgi:hypothetical protein
MAQERSVDKRTRGRRALQHIYLPPDGQDDPELVINTTRASFVDAFMGAAIMATIEHHLSIGGKGRSAKLLVPHGGEIMGRFCTMMSTAPSRCSLELPLGQTAPVRDGRVLLPATRVRSMEEANAFALFLQASSQRSQLGDVRLTTKEAAVLAEAVPALVENGLEHGSSSSCDVVICAALESDNREAQLVVLDLDESAATSSDPLAHLREAWAQSRENLGGLYYITESATNRDLDISLQLKTGTAAAHWRSRFNSENADFTPGWAAGITIHR